VAILQANKPSVRGRRPWLLPALVCLALLALTTAVWRQQVQHQRELWTRHTADVCVQASRRLEVLVGARLTVAQTFARRWANHEHSDFSRDRFTEFARAILAELPDYRAVALVPADGSSPWLEPDPSPAFSSFLGREAGPLLAAARRRDRPVIASPADVAREQTVLYAALPLLRQAELLGHIVVELDAQALFDELLAPPMRTDFAFEVRDAGRVLRRYLPDMDEAAFAEAAVRSSRSFSVANHTWEMTVVPQSARLYESTWRASLAIPAFGLGLSFGLGALSYLLLVRIRAYRWARDDALHELAERRKAEQALRASEGRYRSVFDASSDGLLVLEPEGRIIEASPAACAMHGYPHGGLTGTDVRAIIAPDQQGRFDDFVAQIEACGSVSLESVDLLRDGTEIDVEVRGTRMQHEGQPALLAVIRDVSERRLAMQQQTLLSRQVLVAQEEERARLSRDLHDGLGQTLTALRFELDWLARKHSNGSNDPHPFAQATVLLETSAQELRRMCRGLRPPLLDDMGFEPAVRQLIEEFEEHGSAQVDLTVKVEDDVPKLAPEAALCAFRVLQEALTNVSRHSQARRVRVGVLIDREELVIAVRDDGQGFDPADARRLNHLGIAGMRERAKLVNGKLELRSQPGQGTRVTLSVPVKTPARKESVAREEPHDSHIGSG
jgi:PAS domain S-box-containing protein